VSILGVSEVRWKGQGEIRSGDSSKWPGLGSFGVGVAVEVRCRGDVGGQAPSILTFTPRLRIGSCPCVGDGLLGLVCVDPVYRALKLSPLYHLEEGIKEESRNRYFL